MEIKDAFPGWCFWGLGVPGQHGWVVHGSREEREAVLGWLVPGELGEGQDMVRDSRAPSCMEQVTMDLEELALCPNFFCFCLFLSSSDCG